MPDSNPRRSLTKARGQALLMGALTLLVVTLMVILTLEIGMRTKRRMEAQVLADAAAYNHAVLAARTYNQIALMNRASVAVWVSLAATQSLISWSGAAMNYAIEVLYTSGAAKNMAEAAKTACPLTPAYLNQWNQHFNKPGGVQARFGALDAAAGARAIADQGKAVSLRNAAGAAMALLATKPFQSQTVTEDVLARAYPGSALAHFPFKAGVGSNPVVPSDSENETRIALFAVMGSRGNTFVSKRGPVVVPTTVFPPGSNFTLTETSGGGGGGGGSGFGPPGAGMNLGTGSTSYPDKTARHRAQAPATVSGLVSWADDDGNDYDWELKYTCKLDGSSATLTYQNAAQGANHAGIDAYVGSTDQHDNNDEHMWQGRNDRFNPQPVEKEHTLYCQDPPGKTCHGVFGGGYAFNEAAVADPGQLFAQPMMTSVVTLDVDAVKSPWDLDFTFRNGADTGSFATKPPGMGTLSAMSTGIAYYHRPSDIHEAPNFYNPYWRATIMSGVLNKAGPGLADPTGTTGQLMAKGYRGF